ncbi:hypothetical protein K438DRAFT_1794914, partial [Mycena galopus ATCC 62051]
MFLLCVFLGSPSLPRYSTVLLSCLGCYLEAIVNDQGGSNCLSGVDAIDFVSPIFLSHGHILIVSIPNTFCIAYSAASVDGFLPKNLNVRSWHCSVEYELFISFFSFYLPSGECLIKRGYGLLKILRTLFPETSRRIPTSRATHNAFQSSMRAD